MIKIRNYHTTASPGSWKDLGLKRQQLLKRSWAGVFRDHLLEHLPTDALASSFCDGFGRPSKDLRQMLGILILQQLRDLTDAQTVEAVSFNIAWHYALDIRSEEEAYLCERTLRNYRQLVIEHSLDEVLFQRLTGRLIEAAGVDTSKQRLDSTAVRSYMRSLTRLGIIVETIGKFLRELKRTHTPLFEQAASELVQKYTTAEGKDCFAQMIPSESKRRLPEVAEDLYRIIRQYHPTEAVELESFELLERVFNEQCELASDDRKEEEPWTTVAVKPPKEIPCDNVLNPADPDASYNKRRGVGYLVQVMETFTPDDGDREEGLDEEAKEAAPKAPDKPDLITYVAVGKMTVHDQWALEPALDDTGDRAVAPKQLLADAHYGSNDCMRWASERDVQLVAPSMPPKGVHQGKLTLEDFVLDAEGRMVRCPAGRAPVDTCISKSRLQATFDQGICADCPLRENCGIYGKKRYQYTHDRVRQRIRRLTEREPSFQELYRWRGGIEGTVSRLKHQMKMADLRVRGMQAVTYVAFLRALGLNIYRMAVWRENTS